MVEYFLAALPCQSMTTSAQVQNIGSPSIAFDPQPCMYRGSAAFFNVTGILIKRI